MKIPKMKMYANFEFRATQQELLMCATFSVIWKVQSS